MTHAMARNKVVSHKVTRASVVGYNRAYIGGAYIDRACIDRAYGYLLLGFP